MEELLEKLWAFLRADAELNTLFNGELIIRFMRRQREDPFPCIVYNYRADPDQPWPMQKGVIVMAIIDSSDNAELCFQITKRLRHLLERAGKGDIFTGSLNPDRVKACRLWLGGDQAVDTGSDIHWQRNQTIQFRFYDQELALAVLQR